MTQSEAEALHLEQNLVKRHRPPFNVRLRDDKSFPYIAVTVSDSYPRVMFTRERHRRDTVYFGPYANAKKVRETLDVLNRVFQFRPCEGPKPGRHSGIPCLDFHIERCTAPCIGAISEEDYGAIVEGVIEFLSGETRPIRRALEQRMRDAAAEERFEEAARYRNRLRAIESLAQRQAADKQAVGTIDVDRARSRRRPRRGAALPAPRREARRPVRLPPGERRRAGPRHDPRVVLRRALRQRARGAAAGDRPVRHRGHGGARRVPRRSARRTGRGSRSAARREAASRRARGGECAARAGARPLGARAAPAAACRGARAAARVAQPREPAGADRVLRRLEHPGQRDRRLDVGLRRRGVEARALPHLRGARPRGPGRLRGDGPGRGAKVRAAARRRRRPTATTRASRPSRTSS